MTQYRVIWLPTVLLCICIMTVATAGTAKHQWMGLNLPDEHIPYFFHNNPKVSKKCAADDGCPYKKAIEESKEKFWGYEQNCPVKPLLPNCPESHRQWAQNETQQQLHFWNTADFGYVRTIRDQLRHYCKPEGPGDSSLKCNEHLQYCEAKNIYFDLATAKLMASNEAYREDVIGPGQVGGHCKLDQAALKKQLDHKSPLQSWAAELEHYTSYPFRPIADNKCDVVISRPTFLIKLDAVVNMYHHFCDYVNLYVSQHVNNTFSMDINILIWVTTGHPKAKLFIEMWQAYSKHPLILLNEFDGRKLCIKSAVFSLLARMRLGLYYNMPLMPGCFGSKMIRAFSHHIMHRLNIPQHGPLERKIRVTLLERSTKYRKILNQEELVAALRTDPELEVRVVDYHIYFPLYDQFEITHNSDIFIGMHGAGLTHLLFQPDWAVIFELYSCEDTNCYYDLARLRGINYITWEKQDKLVQQDKGHHPTLGDHPKFTNYAFDVEEFMRLIRGAVDHVKQHHAFIAAWQSKYSASEVSQEEDSASTDQDISNQSPRQHLQHPEL